MLLFQRILTAIIGIPVVVFLIHQSGELFASAVVFLAAVALCELNNMAKSNKARIYLLSSMLPIILLCLTVYFLNNFMLSFFLVTIITLFIFLEGICRHKEKNWFYSNLYSILAVNYIGLFFSQIILLRQYNVSIEINTLIGNLPSGEVMLWLALIGTWASDTFAYFIGTAIGKNKMCPAISPNKSWEGAIGGFLGCVLSVYLLGQFVFFVENINLIIFGLIVAFFAPLGDLAESQIKRFSGVKDSGSLFPGHGGVLDRLDSLLFVAPAICAYLYITTL